MDSLLRRALVFLVAAPLLLAGPVQAASPAAVAAVAAQLHAPSCPPNFSVADCPTDEARQMRDRIGSLLDQGLTPDQVVAVFVRDYGPQARFVPASRGAGLIAWLLPGFAVLVGAAACLRFVRRGQAQPPAPGEPEPAGGGEPGKPAERGEADTAEPGDDPVLAERLKDYL